MTDAAPASPDATPGAALAKAALYLRVSTGRQAESDLSIPDQRRQITACCVAKGWDVAAEFVEPGNTATDDRRPAFQAMIDAPFRTKLRTRTPLKSFYNLWQTKLQDCCIGARQVCAT